MRGKAATKFPFNTKIKRTLHTRLRQARFERLESDKDKEQPLILPYSDSESEKEAEIMGDNPP